MQHPFFRHDPHGTPRPHFSPSLPQVELEIVRGAARFRRRPVEVAVFLIGTATDCDLVLGDPQFADVHAYLIVGPRGVSIRHLGFVPNLSVNGQTVHAANLADGDRLRLGTYEFRLGVRGEFSAVPGGHSLRAEPIAAQRTQQALGNVVDLLNDIRGMVQPAAPQLHLYTQREETRALTSRKVQHA